MQRDAPFLRAWSEAQTCGPIDDEPAVHDALAFRTLWISDLHLGTPGCQAQALLDFLKRTECETLFLVGDIIDGWQLRRQWYWPQAHNDVIQKLLRKARKGTRVIFIPGNHDEFARRYVGHNFGGIDVAEEWIHETADGTKLWVMHGDLFDGVVQCAAWLAHVGDWGYGLLLRLNRAYNAWRAWRGQEYWSLSRAIKARVVLGCQVGSFTDSWAMIAAAVIFGRLGDRIGAQRAILIGLAVFMFVTCWALFLETTWQFYVMAALVGCVQGGVQSLSRSLYSRLIPRERAGEYFGFYNMLGKFAAVVGPLLVGVTAVVSGSPRIGVSSLLLLFVGGAVLLWRVRVPRAA